MATDNFVKLRDVIVPDIREDGTIRRVGRHGTPFKTALNVEKTGKNNMFMFVPEFLGEFLGKWQAPGGVTLVDKRMKSNSNETRWALMSRDPDAIEKAYSVMVNAYVDSKAETTVVPMIIIYGADGHRGGGSGIDLKFSRYLKNLAVEKHDHNRSHYEWNDELIPKSKTNMWLGSDDKEMPYTKELWDKLVAMRHAIDEGRTKLHNLIQTDKLAPLLLSSDRVPLLTQDK